MADVIAACAWITVPAVIPFTMQSFAIFLTLYLLGGRRGTLSTAIYVFLGAVGVPVFSGFRGGAAVLLGPTGGYIWGFILLACVYWLLEKKLGVSKGGKLFLMALCQLLCYGCGTLWFYLTCGGSRGFGAILAVCVIPFIIPDLLKLILAFGLSLRLTHCFGLIRE